MADAMLSRAVRYHGRRASSMLVLPTSSRLNRKIPLQARGVGLPPLCRCCSSDAKGREVGKYTGFSPSSGVRTLENVVRELNQKGLQPGQHGGHDFVDIDASLMEDLNMERAFGLGVESLEEEGAEENATWEEDSCEVASGSSRGQHHAWGSDAYEAPSGVSARRAVTEDVLHLSEEELKERVRASIEELVPSSAAATTGIYSDEDELTPAQLFYLENRDSLVQRAQDYYLKKHEEQTREGDDIEEEWRYYHDPVVRPAKGHLWAVDGDDEPGREQGYLEVIEEWPQGQLPSAQMLADLLRLERAQDVVVVDLHACGRHDVGTHGIVGTGITTQHCRRLGEIAAKATQYCRPPYVEAFCFGTRNDEWVVAHCGSIKVHLFTQECRQQYNLELMWENPQEFFLPGHFPHYVQISGMASDAYVHHLSLGGGDAFVGGALAAGHSVGSRSTAIAPSPYRDGVHEALMQTDYDAAEEGRYVAPPKLLGASRWRDDATESDGHPAWEDTSGAEQFGLDAGAVAAARAADAYWDDTEALTDDEHDAEVPTDDEGDTAQEAGRAAADEEGEEEQQQQRK